MRCLRLPRALRGLCLLATAAVAGCSTQTSQESFSTSSLPRPSEGMVREAPSPYMQTGSLGQGTAAPTRASAYQPRWSNQQQNPTGPISPSPEPLYPQPARYHAYEPGARTPMPRGYLPADGPTVEVREGDTLYGLARQHGVTVADLINTNHLSSVKIDPGQRLRLPPPGH